MKLKNKLILEETKRFISSNSFKLLISLNLIFASLNAILTQSEPGFTLYYYEQIFGYYINWGMILVMMSTLLMTISISSSLSKNYSLISRFKSKKEYIKKVITINSLVNIILMITCYMVTFLAYNIFSNVSHEIRIFGVMEIYELNNLYFLIWILGRSLVLITILNIINVIFLYVFNKKNIFVINLILIYFLFRFNNSYSHGDSIKSIDWGVLNISRYFRFSIYSDFHVELIGSIIIIVILSLISYLLLKMFRYIKTIEQ